MSFSIPLPVRTGFVWAMGLWNSVIDSGCSHVEVTICYLSRDLGGLALGGDQTDTTIPQFFFDPPRDNR